LDDNIRDTGCYYYSAQIDIDVNTRTLYHKAPKGFLFNLKYIRTIMITKDSINTLFVITKFSTARELRQFTLETINREDWFFLDQHYIVNNSSSTSARISEELNIPCKRFTCRTNAQWYDDAYIDRNMYFYTVIFQLLHEKSKTLATAYLDYLFDKSYMNIRTTRPLDRL